jgi:hypothetical protein
MMPALWNDDEIYTISHSPPEVASCSMHSISNPAHSTARTAQMGDHMRTHTGRTNPISPKDTESLTFIHDIPVVESFDPAWACALNSGRRACEGTGHHYTVRSRWNRPLSPEFPSVSPPLSSFSPTSWPVTRHWGIARLQNDD